MCMCVIRNSTEMITICNLVATHRKVQTLDWSIGMDYWTGGFNFILHSLVQGDVTYPSNYPSLQISTLVAYFKLECAYSQQVNP